MKLLEYKQFNNSPNEEKSLNKKKVTVTAIIFVIILIIGIITIAYISSANVRNFMDKYILFKTVKENDLAYINIESDNNTFIYAYSNYIVTLDNNKLTLYNTSGNKVETFNMNLNEPIFSAKNNYFVIGEKNQQKIYVLKDKKILWEKSLEGQLTRVNVNENGYVATIVSGTSYKSVISVYSETGAELFKTYLSNTTAVNVDISKDNKYVSFCEMDLSGTIIESKVKTISIEKAKQDPANAIIHTYDIPSNVLVTNLKYHEKDELLCICENEILKLKNGMVEKVEDLTQGNIAFSGIQLSKSYFKLVENFNGINNQYSNLEIYNTSNNKKYLYTVNGIAKSVYAKDRVIAINLGTEIFFVDEKGWLIKRYTSNQEIKDVVISNNVAGIIFRNKLEFMSL